MSIVFSEISKEFHLYNDQISYIIQILGNGELGNLYYGKRIHHKDDFSYLLEGGLRSLAVYTKENDYFMSPQYTRMEYPDMGRGDFREPAYEIQQANGSNTSSFIYRNHRIFAGKKPLEGLPSLYVESDCEATTLEILMQDQLTGMEMTLSYTVYEKYPVIARSVRFKNKGTKPVVLNRALSASIDLPDADFGNASVVRRLVKRTTYQVQKASTGYSGNWKQTRNQQCGA